MWNNIAKIFMFRFIIAMRVQRNDNYTHTFKNGGFYNTTGELEKNIILSRAIIDLAGCDVPWVIMANNKHERIERARRYTIVFILGFLSPIALVPGLNRFAMKYMVKLTKSFWANNHKAMHLSNKYLVSAAKTKEGLTKLARKTTNGPIEAAYYKLTGKKQVQAGLKLKELLEQSGGDWEKLRQKLISAKNTVLCTDFLMQGIALGSLGFVNNYLTKKKTGESGFSAEFKMADKKIVEKRADDYEKNKFVRYAGFLAMAAGLGTLIPLALKKGLRASDASKFGNFVKKHADKFDYEKGIYMSRLAFLILILVMNHGGLLIASRNKTEAKDVTIRMGGADIIFFGGDLVIASLLANMCDRLFKTKLVNHDKKAEKSLFRKIFPKVKPIREINELVDEGKIAPVNKKLATGLYWTNLGILAFGMGYLIPTLINKIIRTDVKKDVEKENKISM